MILPESDAPLDRMCNFKYYERLTRESEFNEHTDKHVFENEVARRFRKQKEEREVKIEQRRRRLIELIRCEAERDRVLCKEKIQHERDTRRIALFEEAERLKQEMKDKEAEIARDKYESRDILTMYPIREKMSQMHATEIARDRQYLAQMKARDEEKQSQADEWLSQQPSLWDEHVLKKEAQEKKTLELNDNVVRENMRTSELQEEEKKRQENLKLEEDRQMMAQLKEYETNKQNELFEHFKAKKVSILKARGDVQEMKRYRNEEKKLIKIVDEYCNPIIPAIDPNIRLREREFKRDELQRYLDYHRSVKRDEKCYDKFVEQQNAQIRTTKEAAAKEKRMKERAKVKEIEKAMLAQQLQAMNKKKEDARNMKIRIKEDGQQVRKECDNYAAELKEKRQANMLKTRAFAVEMIEERMKVDEIRKKLGQEEADRERKALWNAECDYQKRLKAVLSQNPFSNILHPWRKQEMTNDH